MSQPLPAAARHWTGFDLRCRACGGTTSHRYPGKKTPAALRRLRAAAQRGPCSNCNAKNWENP